MTESKCTHTPPDVRTATQTWNESTAPNNTIAGEPSTAALWFVKLSIAHNKIKELDGRVQSCGGPANSGRIDGRPDIDRIKDADLPTEDPVESLNDFRADLDRPPSASPFF